MTPERDAPVFFSTALSGFMELLRRSISVVTLAMPVWRKRSIPAVLLVMPSLILRCCFLLAARLVKPRCSHSSAHVPLMP